MVTKERPAGRIPAPYVLPEPLRRFDCLTNHSQADSLAAETVQNILDVVDDLCELKHLVSDLNDSPISKDDSDANLPQDWLGEAFQRTIDLIGSRVERNFDVVERATRWGKSGGLSSLLANIRKDFHSTKSALKNAYRQRGTMLCADDWQSPIYASATPMKGNRLQEGIREHVLDYKRDGHLDAAAYEEQFLHQYTNHLGSRKLKAYLANSGMGAFSTLLHWLAHEANMGNTALALLPMYFENIHLARGFFPNLQSLHSHGEQDILAWLQENNPSVVIVDAVTNTNDVIAHDLDMILAWATEQAKHEVAIVIDTTCLPCPLLPAQLLKTLPDNVMVFLVESLAKHHQFGMDTVTGGITVAHMSPESHSSFAKARARFGANISDSSVGSLPQPDNKRLVRRMQRHSRNVHLFATAIESYLGKRDSVIASLSWLRDGGQDAEWYRGSCLTIHLHKAFQSIDRYRQFEDKVLQAARQRRHPLALSTSFGFDVTRFYVTAPSTKFEPPFLRVAIGTETTAEMSVLSEIIKGVDEELAVAWDAKSLVKFESAQAKIEPSFLPAVAPRLVPERGRKEALYAGENSLKDYLCPENYPPTPLVELPEDLNPYKKDGVRIFAKMMPLVPLMNIKSIPAYSMLAKAAQRGELKDVGNVIESSSSNTVLSLSVMAKLFGIDNTCAIVDHSIAPALLNMLRLFGIEIFKHPAAGHPLFGKMEPRSDRAANMGNEQGWINPGQYTNPDNPAGFAQWLAPDLWSQTGGKLAIISLALGTCGTMVGVARGLRKHNPNIEVVACCPQAGDAVPGPREQSLLKDVTFDWQDVPNNKPELTAVESFAASVKLLRRGILGGPSSGMNYAGLLQHLAQEKASGRLEKLRQEKGEIWCAFMCCDSPLPHVEEYYDALGEEYFPIVHAVPGEEEALLTSHEHPVS